jgi:hypothetical protein
MSYVSLLRPRPEVLSEEGVEPIIDLANVEDTRRQRLEARPADFFALTYPTSDVRRVVQSLGERFRSAGERGIIPGLFLFEGLKGSGKSHLLVLIYHLFKNPSLTQTWLAKHGLTCSLPSDTVVVLNKFTDQPLYSIWDFVFLKLTGSPLPQAVIQPGLADVQQVLGDRRLILVFDELEQGIRAIGDPAVQAQNIAFLQMLSEWGNRSDQVTLFASIYSDVQEPGNTLKRVPALRVQFAQSSERDRAQVVLHRLFEDYLDLDPKKVAPVVDGYINYWTRYHAFNADEYRARLLQMYPFTPDLLDVLLKRVPARGGFQNVRGALGFLANLVKLTHQTANLITPGHASLHDRETVVRLTDLDTTGDLVNRSRDNLNDLADTPLAAEIAAATMLYTLAGTGRMVGATHDELLRACVQPGVDINEFERALAAFQRYAANYHENAGLYYFDLEENADAKVEFQALRREYEERAPAELRKVWQSEVFKETSAVIYGDEEETREAIEKLDKGRLRWVLAPRRLTPQERHSLYFGLTARNEVILLEPKDAKFDLDRNADLLKWMKRSLAAQDLASRTKDSKRRDEYQRIARDEQGYVVQAIRRAGLVYISWTTYAAQPLADEVEEESLGNATAKQDIHTMLGQSFYPVPFFVDHMAERLSSLRGRTVKDIEQEYRNTLGFPVPTHADRITKAIRDLCKESKLSVNHQRGNICGRNPDLTDAELMNATVDAPLPKEVPEQSPTGMMPRGESLPKGEEATEESWPSEDSAGGAWPDTSVMEMVQSISTLPQPNVGQLRQDIAERLQAIPNPHVRQVIFTTLLEQSPGDLSVLPAAFRGSLAGPGELFAEITIKRRGDFSKAEVEQMAERLPVVPGASYSAQLKVVAGGNND